MMLYLLKVGKICFGILYVFFKLFKTQRKVVFLSRQLNALPVDFYMLEREILRRDTTVKTVAIYGRIEPNVKSLFRFIKNTWLGLYHVATARVVVTDTYSPLISLLKHKPELFVVQLWHAMGAIKKFSYQNLDTEGGGRTSDVARVMNLHQGYDLLITGGTVWHDIYEVAFGVNQEMMYPVGLPRIDYMLAFGTTLQAEIFDKYPALAKKPNVLYAPTWRKTGVDGWEGLVENFDFEQFNLVVKSHPNQQLTHEHAGIFSIPEYDTLQCLAITEFLITDYSALALEAAALDIKTFYYVYDYDIYADKNGLNIDLKAEIPGCVFENADELLTALTRPYPVETLRKYQQKFVSDLELGKSTERITTRILENLP